MYQKLQPSPTLSCCTARTLAVPLGSSAISASMSGCDTRCAQGSTAVVLTVALTVTLTVARVELEPGVVVDAFFAATVRAFTDRGHSRTQPKLAETGGCSFFGG